VVEVRQRPVIESCKLLSPTECEDVFARLCTLRHAWVERQAGWMYTLGAATYLDPEPDYSRLAAGCNPILQQAFADLYARLAAHVEASCGRPAVYDPALALPGFHIFLLGPEQAGKRGRAHYDLPHLQRRWGGPIGDPFSLTLAVRLPRAGGGLNWWEGEAQHYLPYATGHIYRIGADVRHQIANEVSLLPGDARVTLQTHAVLRGDGRYVLYF
jgi:hypothetical protein